MIVNVERYTNFLNDKELNPSQFLICYLIYLGKPKLLSEWNYRQQQVGQTGVAVEDLVDLVNKQYLFAPQKKDVNGDYLFSSRGYPIYDWENGVIAESLQEELVINSDDAAEELFEIYPFRINIGNGNSILKSYGGDPEQAKELYRKFIQGDRLKHEEVKRRLKIAEENGLINCGFYKFVSGKLWEDPKIDEYLNNSDNQGYGEEWA